MQVEYLDFVSYQKTMQKCAFLFSTDDDLETLKNEKNVYLFGTGLESYQARTILERKGIKIDGYLDNFKENQGKSINGILVNNPYDYFKKVDGVVVIAVPRQHINYVRLQLMIYNIERYSIFFIEDFHSFSNDMLQQIHEYIMDGVNWIGLDKRKMLDAVPYVQISSGLDGAKLGNLNYLLYSTTWSNHVYKWLFEEYKNIEEMIEVLEIGPGHGLLSYVLKRIKRNINLEWICFDSKDKVSRESNENYERSLEKIRELYPEDSIILNKGFFESDEYKLEKKYDLIIMTEVFEHFVTNPLTLTKKISSALKLGGKLYLTTPDWGHLYMYESWKEMKDYSEFESEEQYLSMYAGHTYQYSKAELDEIFQLAGLKVVKYALSDARNHNYLLEKIGCK